MWSEQQFEELRNIFAELKTVLGGLVDEIRRFVADISQRQAASGRQASSSSRGVHIDARAISSLARIDWNALKANVRDLGREAKGAAGEVGKVTTAVERLANAMGRLRDSVGSIGWREMNAGLRGFVRAVESLSQLGPSVSSLKDVSTGIRYISSAAERLSNLSAAKLRNIGEALQQVAEGTRQIAGLGARRVSGASSILKEITESIQELSEVSGRRLLSVGNAISSLHRGLSKLVAIDNKDLLNVSKSVRAAAASLQELSEVSGKGVGDISRRLAPLAEGLSAIADVSARKLANAGSAISETARAIRSLVRVSPEQMVQSGQALTSLADGIRSVVRAGIGRLGDFAENLDRLSSIGKIEIEISTTGIADAISQVQGIRELNDALSTLLSTVRGISDEDLGKLNLLGAKLAVVSARAGAASAARAAGAAAAAASGTAPSSASAVTSAVTASAGGGGSGAPPGTPPAPGAVPSGDYSDIIRDVLGKVRLHLWPVLLKSMAVAWPQFASGVGIRESFDRFIDEHIEHLMSFYSSWFEGELRSAGAAKGVSDIASLMGVAIPKIKEAIHGWVGEFVSSGVPRSEEEVWLRAMSPEGLEGVAGQLESFAESMRKSVVANRMITDIPDYMMAFLSNEAERLLRAQLEDMAGLAGVTVDPTNVARRLSRAGRQVAGKAAELIAGKETAGDIWNMFIGKFMNERIQGKVAEKFKDWSLRAKPGRITSFEELSSLSEDMLRDVAAYLNDFVRRIAESYFLPGGDVIVELAPKVTALAEDIVARAILLRGESLAGIMPGLGTAGGAYSISDIQKMYGASLKELRAAGAIPKKEAVRVLRGAREYRNIWATLEERAYGSALEYLARQASYPVLFFDTELPRSLTPYMASRAGAIMRRLAKVVSGLPGDTGLSARVRGRIVELQREFGELLANYASMSPGEFMSRFSSAVGSLVRIASTYGDLFPEARRGIVAALVNALPESRRAEVGAEILAGTRGLSPEEAENLDKLMAFAGPEVMRELFERAERGALGELKGIGVAAIKARHLGEIRARFGGEWFADLTRPSSLASSVERFNLAVMMAVAGLKKMYDVSERFVSRFPLSGVAFLARDVTRLVVDIGTALRMYREWQSLGAFQAASYAYRTPAREMGARLAGFGIAAYESLLNIAATPVNMLAHLERSGGAGAFLSSVIGAGIFGIGSFLGTKAIAAALTRVAPGMAGILGRAALPAAIAAAGAYAIYNMMTASGQGEDAPLMVQRFLANMLPAVAMMAMPSILGKVGTGVAALGAKFGAARVSAFGQGMAAAAGRIGMAAFLAPMLYEIGSGLILGALSPEAREKAAPWLAAGGQALTAGVLVGQMLGWGHGAIAGIGVGLTEVASTALERGGHSTMSSIVRVAGYGLTGTAIGMMVGGPIGALIGGAIGTAVGIGVEIYRYLAKLSDEQKKFTTTGDIIAAKLVEYLQQNRALFLNAETVKI